MRRRSALFWTPHRALRGGVSRSLERDGRKGRALAWLVCCSGGRHAKHTPPAGPRGARGWLRAHRPGEWNGGERIGQLRSHASPLAGASGASPLQAVFCSQDTRSGLVSIRLGDRCVLSGPWVSGGRWVMGGTAQLASAEGVRVSRSQDGGLACPRAKRDTLAVFGDAVDATVGGVTAAGNVRHVPLQRGARGACTRRGRAANRRRRRRRARARSLRASAGDVGVGGGGRDDEVPRAPHPVTATGADGVDARAAVSACMRGRGGREGGGECCVARTGRARSLVRAVPRRAARAHPPVHVGRMRAGGHRLHAGRGAARPPGAT